MRLKSRTGLANLILWTSLLWISSCAHEASSSSIESSTSASEIRETAEVSNVGTTSRSNVAKTIRCKISGGDQLRLCRSVMPDSYKEDQVSLDAFEITTFDIDLNNDHTDEVIVWESSWAGTSGGSLWILSRRGDRYKILFKDDAAWTPIAVLPSTHHGWRDVSYLETGGGVEPMFITVRHVGKAYVDAVGKNPEQSSAAEIVIDRNWEQTTFGPAIR